jgi:hypothetical protein
MYLLMKLFACLILFVILEVLVMVKKFPDVSLFILLKIIQYFAFVASSFPTKKFCYHLLRLEKYRPKIKIAWYVSRSCLLECKCYYQQFSSQIDWKWKETLAFSASVFIVQMLGERSLSFHGHQGHLYAPNNGNFLSQVEQLTKFVQTFTL